MNFSVYVFFPNTVDFLNQGSSNSFHKILLLRISYRLHKGELFLMSELPILNGFFAVNY